MYGMRGGEGCCTEELGSNASTLTSSCCGLHIINWFFGVGFEVDCASSAFRRPEMRLVISQVSPRIDISEDFRDLMASGFVR